MRHSIFNTLKKHWFGAGLAGLAVIGALLLIYSMRWGPWAFSDSTAYIASARSLAAGKGLGYTNPDGRFIPLVLHQPLYAILMSLPLRLADIHPFTTTEALNTAAFFGSILLLGAGIARFSRSKLAALSGAVLFLSAPNIISNFDGAMSEPLYIFLTLAAFFLLLAYLTNPRAAVLAAAGLAAGLAFFTRYIGLANLALGAGLIFFFSALPLKKRLLDSLLFLLAGFLPYGVYLALTFPLPAARQPVWPADLAAAGWDYLQKVSLEIGAWFPFHSLYLKSAPLAVGALVVLGLLLGLGVIRLARQSGRQPELRPVYLYLLATCGMLAVYTLVFFATYAFNSIQPDINQRTFVPLQPFFYLALSGGLLLPAKSGWRRRLAAAAALGLVLLLLFENVPLTQRYLQKRHLEGSGYTAEYWRASTLLSYARNIPPEVVIYTNQPALILLYMDRYPYDLDALFTARMADQYPFLTGWQPPPELPADCKGEGCLVLIFEPQFTNRMMTRFGDGGRKIIEEFKAGLSLVERSANGEVYRVP